MGLIRYVDQKITSLNSIYDAVNLYGCARFNWTFFLLTEINVVASNKYRTMPLTLKLHYQYETQ